LAGLPERLKKECGALIALGVGREKTGAALLGRVCLTGGDDHAGTDQSAGWAGDITPRASLCVGAPADG